MTSRHLALPALAALAVLGVSGCAAPGEADSSESSISIAVPSLGAEYNPALAYMHASLNINAVYDSLLIRDTDGDGYAPWLATEWTVSDDRKTVDFTLREDVDFVDGVHLDAQAVVDYLGALREVDGFYGAAGWAEDGYEFEVTGEYEFRFTTTRPLTGDDLGGISTVVPIASPEGILDPESISTDPVGSGPYLLEETVPEVSATFVRNPNYWNPDAFPYDTVELLVFNDDVAALNALKSGQIDAAELSIPNAIEAESEGFTLTEGRAGYFSLYFVDRAGTLQPALADVRVRQAIAYAFDRELINETLNLGYGLVSSQPFSPKSPMYVEGGDDRYAYDLEKARQLMAEAGYADGFDLTIPITTFQNISSTGPAVQQALSEIGITVTFDDINDVGLYFERARDGSYPVILYKEVHINTLGVYVAPDAFFNYLGYEDPTVTELVETVRQGSQEESDEAAARLGEYVLEQAWIAPFSEPNMVWATRPGVTVDLASSEPVPPYLVNFGATD